MKNSAKKILSFFLAAFMLIPQGTVFAADSAETVEHEHPQETDDSSFEADLTYEVTSEQTIDLGSFGDDITWTVEGDPSLGYNYTLTVSGTGDMPEEEAPWIEYAGDTSSLIFEGDITSISNEAFLGFSEIETLELPDTVTSIGDNAFSGCWMLETVKLPKALTSIGDYAFAACENLTGFTSTDDTTVSSLDVAKNLTTIGSYSFAYCNSLADVTIPSSVTSVGDMAFYACEGLEEVTVLSRDADFGADVFADTADTFKLYCKEGSTAEEYASENGYASEVYEIIVSGTCGDNLTWVLYADGELVISGTGEMWDWRRYSPYLPPWYENYSTQIKTVTIELGVTTVSNYAFMCCTNLTSVDIGDDVETIGSYVFEDCTSLANVDIGDSVKSIDVSAFAYCKSLESVTIPDSVTVIAQSAFRGCTSLRNVIIGNSVKNISDSVFYYCESLTSVEIPDSVEIIGDYAFECCTNLTRVVIGAGTRNIGQYAFGDCTSLTEIIVDENNKYYSNDEFGVLFNNNKTTLIQYPIGNPRAAYTIPTGVENIGEFAFTHCTSLKSIDIPKGVTNISEKAFHSCTTLANITIPSSVTSIGGEVFRNCSSLTKATILNQDATFGEYVFLYTPDTLEIHGYTGSTAETYANNNGHTFVALEEPRTIIASGECGDDLTWTLYDDGELVISGTGAMTDWSSYSSVPWDSYRSQIKKFTIGEGVTTIGDYAFYNCTSLTSVDIGEVVTTIGYRAFSDCTSLTSVDIGDSVTTIDWYAFYNCKSLTNAVIPDSVTTIGGGAFAYCTSLTRLDIPDSVTTIGGGAFEYCTSLTSLDIPDSVTTIGYRAFRSCTSLTSLDIPDSVTTICEEAFSDCTSLTSVEIGDSVTTIGEEAFYNCMSLASLDIPDSVTTIGTWAFEYCTSLTSLDIPDSVTTIGYGAFWFCKNLTSIAVDANNANYSSDEYDVLYDKAKTTLIQYPIGNERTTYTIPDSVTTIDNCAFRSCTSLTNVVIPDSVTTIGGGAFEYCTSLTKAKILTTDATFGSSVFRYTPDTFEIHGYTGSTAETYANENGHIFVPIEERVITASGECGDNLTWTLYADGELVIEGTGEMWDYEEKFASPLPETPVGSITPIDGTIIELPDTDVGEIISGTVILNSLSYNLSYIIEEAIGTGRWYSTAPWHDYRSDISSLTIESGVTSIGDYAFYKLNDLINTSIADTVTTIGTGAFNGCLNMANVDIPDSVTSIGDSAFSNCKTFTSVIIPDSVTNIGVKAFYNCIALTDIVVDTNNAYYSSDGYGVLFDKDKTTLIQYPMANERTAYTIPESVTTVCAYAFYSSDNLTSVDIPDLIDVINEYTFAECESLTSVSIPDSVGSINNHAFAWCDNLVSVDIPDSVMTIGNYAFYSCISLTNVDISSSLVTIGDSAFTGCNSLIEITIPDGAINSIGDYAFSSCDNLVKAIIGSKDVTFGTNVFKDAPDTFEIHGWRNSTAEAYAKANGHIFVPFDPCAHEAWGEWVIDVATTCTDGGSRSRTCLSCGETSVEPISALGHDYEVTAEVEHTCTEDGYIEYTCQRDGCGASKRYVNFTSGHDYGDDNVCDKCGHTVPMDHEHNFTVVVIAPTCTTIGYTETTCDCGYSNRSDLIEQLGHLFDDGTVTVAKTCTTTGVMTYSCERDGCTATMTEVILASHNWTDTATVEPTCTTDGKVYRKCNDCGMAIAEMLPAEHTWDEGSVTKEATCTEEGTKVCTCTACTATEEFAIPTLGHNFVDGVCTRCGEKFIDTVTPIVDHPIYGMYFEIDDIVSNYGPSLIDEYGVLLDYNPDATIEKVGVYLTQDGTMWRRCIACTGEGITNATYVPYLAYEGDIKYTGLNSDSINIFRLSEGTDGIWKYSNYATIGVNLEDRNGKLLLSLYDIGQAGKETRVFDDLDEMIAWLSEPVRGIIASGECGDDLTWVLYDDGELVISGTGAMWDWSEDDSYLPTWEDYKDSIKSVVVENGVTSIGDKAFFRCYNLASANIPSTVTVIGDRAFQHCTSLTNIDLPEGVETIGNVAFASSGLTSVNIPASVTLLVNNCFISCHNNAAFNVAPLNPKYSSDENGVLFNKDKSLLIMYPCANSQTVYTIPDSVTGIGHNAFSSCKNLTSVVIPDSVTTIGEWAFHNCTSLTSVDIPGSVMTIGCHAFNSCSNLATVTINNTLRKAYTDEDGNITDADGNVVARLTFVGNSKYYAHTVDGSNELINEATALELYGYDEVTDEIKIDYNAFVMCPKLSKATIYKRNATLGTSVFLNAPTTFEIHGYTGSTAETYANKNGHIFVPIDEREIIASGECGDDLTWVLYDDGELVISGTGAMWEFKYTSSAPWYKYRSQIKVATIGDSVTDIGYCAFYDSDNLTDVYIGNSVTIIYIGAFSECESLNVVSIGSSLTKICNKAFYKCSSLENINIPDSVEIIDSAAFEYCLSLPSIYIGKNVSFIGSGAFDNCKSLKNITVNPDNEHFSGNADGVLLNKDQTELILYPIGKENAEYVIPSGVTSIGEGAFAYSTILTSITIPESVTTIDSNAFYRCTSLTSVEIPEGVTSIGGYAFENCESLRKAVILSRGVTFGTGVFKYTHADFEIHGYIGSTAETYANENGHIFVPLREIIASGECGDNLTWTLYDDGELVISGTGAMWNWTSNTKVPWYDYRAQIKTATVKSAATSIGDYAFSNCGSLTNFTLADSVTDIGDYAFRDCVSLTNVVIGENVISIGTSAFSYCDSLTSITVDTDNANYFSDEFGVLFSKTPAILLQYPVGNSRTKYDIPESVTTIGPRAFAKCDALSSMKIGQKINKIGNRAFLSCSGLTEFIVDPDNSYFCNDEFGVLFNKDKTTLMQYPEANASSTYEIPDSVKSINGYAFYYCINLTSVEIPEGAESVGGNAFDGCSKLAKAVIYSRNLTFGSKVFANVTSAFEIHGYTGSTAETYANENGHIFVPLREIIASGECGDNLTWTLYDDGELVISGTGAMWDFEYLEDYIPDAAVLASFDFTLDGYYEYYCTSPWYLYRNMITSVTIDSGVTSIGDYAFYECNSVASVTIPDGITSIGESAFEYCDSLTRIDIPASVTSIGIGAFKACESLMGVYITDIRAWCETDFADSYSNPIYYAGDLYLNGTLVSDLVIPEITDFEVIKAYTFYGCTSLTSVSMGDNITSIGRNAFSECTELTNVTMGKEIKSIGSSAFSSCAKLAKVEIHSEDAKFGIRIFNGASADFEIHGYSGSSAETYANENGHKFVLLDPAPEKFNLSGVTMTLGSSLSLDFAIDTSKLTGTDNYAKMTIVYADGRPSETLTVPQSEWTYYSGTIYTASFRGMSAKQMNDVVSAVFYNAKGQALTFEKSDSIETYAVRMLNGNAASNAKLRTVYVDMLNYGAAAQVQFNYDKVNLANRNLTAAQEAWASSTVYTANKRVSGTGYVGTTLTLGDEIQLDIIFNNSSVGSDYSQLYAIATYTDHYGNSKEIRIEGSDFIPYSSALCQVSIAGMTVADFRSVVNCTVYAADGTVLANAFDSIESYANRNAASLGNVAAAIVKFCDSTYTYFHGSASCVITFDANGGDVSEATRTVLYGNKIGELPMPTRDDYKFLGWYTSDGKAVNDATPVEEIGSMTLTAKWEYAVYTITVFEELVDFDFDEIYVRMYIDGVNKTNIPVSQVGDKIISKLNTLALANLIGDESWQKHGGVWAAQSDGEHFALLEEITKDESDENLEKYGLTELGAETLGADPLTGGKFTILSGVSTAPGYQYKLLTDKDTVFYFIDTTTDDNTTVGEIDVHAYTGAPVEASITFDADTVIYTDKLGIDTGDFANAIIVFDAVETLGFGNDPSYTVSFDLNYDGAPTSTNQTVVYGGTVTEPAEPTRSGYSFAGWFVDDVECDFDNPYDFSLPVEADIELFAKWIEMSDADSDGLVAGLEDYYGTDAADPDTDDDGLNDYIEIFVLATDPLNSDSDGNGISDADEDTDEDGLSNLDEINYATDPADPDSDDDELYDGDEIALRTDPNDPDTDDDGASDGTEVLLGTDPLDQLGTFDVELTTDSDDDTVTPSVKITLSGEQVDSLKIEAVDDETFFSADMPGYMGKAYDFSVDGEFDSATISFEFDSASLDADADPVIYYFNEENQTLEALETTVTGNVASAVVTHFSKYILVDRNVYEETFTWVDDWDQSDNPYTDVEIVFVIDDSGSMTSNDSSNLRLTVARTLIDSLPTNSKIGLVTFNNNTTRALTSTLTDDRENVKNYLTTTYFKSSGGTDMYYGIQKAFPLFESTEDTTLKLIVVLSDGVTSDTSLHSTVISQANNANVRVYTVGLGSSTSYFTDYLKPLATNTGAQFYLASNASELEDIYSEIGDKIDIETDSDNDGVPDYYEDNMIVFNGISLVLDKNNPDTDGDGLLDGEEVIITKEYSADGEKVKITGKLVLGNPTKLDTDGDGFTDDVDPTPLVADTFKDFDSYKNYKYGDKTVITIFIDQPVEGSRDVVDKNEPIEYFGHTFIGMDYDGGEEYAAFVPLNPSNGLPNPSQWFRTVNAELLTTEGRYAIHNNSVSYDANPYDVKGDDWNIAYTFEISDSDIGKLNSYCANYSRRYNLISNNCAKFTVDFLRTLGININVSTHRFTHSDPSIALPVSGRGYSPADLGEDIRANYNDYIVYREIELKDGSKVMAVCVDGK